MERKSKIGIAASAAIGTAAAICSLVGHEQTISEWKAEYEREHGRLFLIDYDWNTHERIWRRPDDGKIIRVAEKDGFKVTVVGER